MIAGLFYLLASTLILAGVWQAYRPMSKKEQSYKDISVEFKKAGFGSGWIQAFQAMSFLETGNFKSELFKNANNMFGMKVPSKRKSLRSGTYQIGNQIYSKYATQKACVLDIIEYLKYCMPLRMQNNIAYGDAMDLLKKWKYAEDPNYKSKCDTIVVQEKLPQDFSEFDLKLLLKRGLIFIIFGFIVFLIFKFVIKPKVEKNKKK